MIKAYGKLILDLAKAGLITKNNALKLLSASEPGLSKARRYGYTAAVEAHNRIVSEVEN